MVPGTEAEGGEAADEVGDDVGGVEGTAVGGDGGLEKLGANAAGQGAGGQGEV